MARVEKDREKKLYRLDLRDDLSAIEVRWLNRPGSGPLRGPHKHPLGLSPWAATGSGMPTDMERPQFEINVDSSDALRDALAAYGSRFLVSARLKDLLSSLDPGAFQFVEASTILNWIGGKQEGPTYFMCDVIKFVDANNESNSSKQEKGAPPRAVGIYGNQNCFFQSRIGANRVFRLMYSPSVIACTEEARSLLLKEHISGLGFRVLGTIDARS